MSHLAKLAASGWQGSVAGGGGAGGAPAVDNLFSTALYTGNRSAQTIANGVDLSTNGGMVWTKLRDTPIASGSPNHSMYDSTQSAFTSFLEPNTAIASTKFLGSSAITPLTNGYSMGTDTAWAHINYELQRYVSWTFRKASKFFDVITWTGDGTVSNRALSHALGIAPGMIIVKSASASGNWLVYHRSLGAGMALLLNNPVQQSGGGNTFGPTLPDASVFYVGDAANTNGVTYVAYLFAHDTSVDGMIQCGIAQGASDINLGWEPQFLLVKSADVSNDWAVMDSARGMSLSTDAALHPNTTAVEDVNNYVNPSATGVTLSGYNSLYNFVYVAIRQSTAVPTVGTQVFNSQLITGNATARTISGVGFSPDLVFVKDRSGTNDPRTHDKLRGPNLSLFLDSTAAENNIATSITSYNADGISIGTIQYLNASSHAIAYWFFKRARKFMDVVAWTGDGNSTRKMNHALGIKPGLLLIRGRTTGSDFETVVMTSNNEYATKLSTSAFTGAVGGSVGSISVGTTATVFSPAIYSPNNVNGTTYVAYLFATLAGVSKVGAYVGTGLTPQTIDCGFSNGARFVLIRRIDGPGATMIFDTVRGIVTGGTDPMADISSPAAEAVTFDYLDPAAVGFIVKDIASTSQKVNVVGGTYMFLAIA